MTTDYKDYPFTVNGVKFISRINADSPFAGTLAKMPTQVVTDLNIQAVTELFAETARPGEPITTGIDIGAGAPSKALMMQKSVTKTSDTLAKMLPFDTDGSIAILYQQAVARGD